MPVTPIIAPEQFEEVMELSKYRLIIIDFWAPWCDPRKELSSHFETMSNDESLERIGFYKIDIDALPFVAQKCKVSVMPTFKCFRNGVWAGEINGSDRDKLDKFVRAQAQKA
ncbi:hypothetical protein BOTBODRAFT_30878 [Botryobasidium botryosum FD-172 SS1]|uniref:Thioredoxin domain-containing protein n=1 Tax=Botryobasidium botryosum (strain FD-172 SS1) TaxID=930990 RepID=A0A067MPA9_BOTB1|nr:hypothetical protein BOTBODRAFT_30878 [Botryobasidium botryosum FD-172 SS1]